MSVSNIHKYTCINNLNIMGKYRWRSHLYMYHYTINLAWLVV